MKLGRVYVWIPDPAHSLHGRISEAVVPLPHLDSEGEGRGRLWGRYLRVRNAGFAYQQDPITGKLRPFPLGDAQPNELGDFLYEPRRGGCRIDRGQLNPCQARYVSAAHFGEVNSYFHLDRIGAYVDELLRELGASSLPRVIALVNAHDGITEAETDREGLRHSPFQGGHYRLASRKYDLTEPGPVSPEGEIHLGPGRQLVRAGALAELVERTGRAYRAIASHNAGILYHEYGHHIARHTADFRANAWRSPANQSNRKSAIEEGTCDYWAATMLGTPHIWAWHHRHDGEVVHPRSLSSRKTMADFDPQPKADPHLNGTIWGALLWELRLRLAADARESARHMDRLLLQTLLLLGRKTGDAVPPTVASVRSARKSFLAGLEALLQADELLHARTYRDLILTTFAARGISLDAAALPVGPVPPPQVAHRLSPSRAELMQSSRRLRAMLKHVAPEEVPENDELHNAASLEAYLHALNEPPPSLAVVGDIMLGGRARKPMVEFGLDYPLRAVRPMLQRAPIGLGNLEGPLAREARRQKRKFAYRVNPQTAQALAEAGINVVTLANNHLLDCGREGVLETLEALAQAGVTAIGAGLNQAAAHRAAILTAGGYRVGLLGYYWNKRTAARARLPGSAMDSPEALARDITALKHQVDRVVVTFHWGVPYVREASLEVRAQARLAVDCGADLVVGHHPHLIQAFEVYRSRPVFFSVGNFAFGSGNSRGESLLLAVRFEAQNTVVQVYPVYVKNRDPRVNYQPKVLRGHAAQRVLLRLMEISGSDASFMSIAKDRGSLLLPRTSGSTAQPDA